MFGKKQQTLEKAETKVGTIIGEGSVIEGNFTSKETTRIDGKIRGDVQCGGSLILGENGVVRGNITAKNVFVSGQVNGDVTAENKIEATSTAKIIGNLDTSVLVVDENAIIHGNCNMHVILPKSEEGQVKKTGKRGRPRKVQVTLPLEDEEKEEYEGIEESLEDSTFEGTEDSVEEVEEVEEETQNETTENKEES